jgi:hypothetical protein
VRVLRLEVQILDSHIVQKRGTRRYTLNLKHVSNVKEFQFGSRGLLNLVQTRWVVLNTESLKVTQAVVQRY